MGDTIKPLSRNDTATSLPRDTFEEAIKKAISLKKMETIGAGFIRPSVIKMVQPMEQGQWTPEAMTPNMSRNATIDAINGLSRQGTNRSLRLADIADMGGRWTPATATPVMTRTNTGSSIGKFSKQNSVRSMRVSDLADMGGSWTPATMTPGMSRQVTGVSRQATFKKNGSIRRRS